MSTIPPSMPQHTPKFSGLVTDLVDCAVGTACVGGCATAAVAVTAPIYVPKKIGHKVKESFQLDSFQRKLRSDNPNQALETSFPDTPKGNKALHERLRWQTKKAVTRGGDHESLLISALDLPRVRQNIHQKEQTVTEPGRYSFLGPTISQPNLDKESKAFGCGDATVKRTLSGKARKHGKDPERTERIVNKTHQVKNTFQPTSISEPNSRDQSPQGARRVPAITSAGEPVSKIPKSRRIAAAPESYGVANAPSSSRTGRATRRRNSGSSWSIRTATPD